MITTSILAILLALLSPFVALLPNISLSGFFNSSGIDTFLEWVSLAGYMLPWETILSIFGIIISIHIIPVVISFLKTVWNMLPFV